MFRLHGKDLARENTLIFDITMSSNLGSCNEFTSSS